MINLGEEELKRISLKMEVKKKNKNYTTRIYKFAENYLEFGINNKLLTVGDYIVGLKVLKGDKEIFSDFKEISVIESPF